jgi:hypothetical protein
LLKLPILSLATTSYESLALSYLPRPDGKVLTESPDVLVKNGKFYAVPMIHGTQEDKGALFSSEKKDMGTTDKIVIYFGQYYFKDANQSQITTFVNTYSTKAADGSPCRSNILFEAYPGERRIVSILGDIVFTLIRRWTLDAVATVRPGLPHGPASPLMTVYMDTVPLVLSTDQIKLLCSTLTITTMLRLLVESTTSFFLIHNMDPNVGVETETFWP